MKIGNGDIGSVLVDRPDRLYFASGVSNSGEERESEYKRERDLLLDQRRDLRIVYFSSLAIFYSDTRYTRHKLDMKEMIKLNFPNYCIVRLGNIDWGVNPNTLINFLKAHLRAVIRDEFRFVISQDEFLWWIDHIPERNVEMNCPGYMMKVKEIRSKYCE